MEYVSHWSMSPYEVVSAALIYLTHQLATEILKKLRNDACVIRAPLKYVLVKYRGEH
jgi:hypothetical protein